MCKNSRLPVSLQGLAEKQNSFPMSTDIPPKLTWNPWGWKADSYIIIAHFATKEQRQQLQNRSEFSPVKITKPGGLFLQNTDTGDKKRTCRNSIKSQGVFFCIAIQDVMLQNKL